MAEYIERETLMKNFCGYDLTKCVKYGNKDVNQRHDSYSTMMMYEIADEIIDAPAADVAPVVHGRWILVDTEKRTGVCSNCNRQDSIDHLAKHCRFCGARMDLEEPNEAKESRQP